MTIMVVEDFLASKLPGESRGSLQFRNELNVLLQASRMAGVKFALDFSMSPPGRKAELDQLEMVWRDWMDKAR